MLPVYRLTARTGFAAYAQRSASPMRSVSAGRQLVELIRHFAPRPRTNRAMSALNSRIVVRRNGLGPVWRGRGRVDPAFRAQAAHEPGDVGVELAHRRR